MYYSNVDFPSASTTADVDMLIAMPNEGNASHVRFVSADENVVASDEELDENPADAEFSNACRDIEIIGDANEGPIDANDNGGTLVDVEDVEISDEKEVE